MVRGIRVSICFDSCVLPLNCTNDFRSKFGLYSVDFTDPSLPRTPKSSVEEVKQIITNRQLPTETYNSSVSTLKWSVATCTLLCATHLITYY